MRRPELRSTVSAAVFFAVVFGVLNYLALGLLDGFTLRLLLQTLVTAVVAGSLWGALMALYRRRRARRR